MSKIGITGGAGFVGTNLARSLESQGHEIIVVDDFSTGLRSNLEGINCEIHEVTIVDFDALERALEGCTYIFHLAARGSVPRSINNPRATFNVNVKGTLNVLEVTRKIGAHIMFSSSSSVYGSNLELPKNEKMWMSPLTPYAASKLSGEALVNSYAESFGIGATTYRFFNIFGPWQRPDHDYAAVIPKWIWKLINGQRIEIFGDGEHSRDFTYIETVINVLIEGMKSNLSHPSPINLAFGSRITLNQLVSILKKSFPALESIHQDNRIGDVRNSQNDPKLLRSIFPNIEPIDFETSIARTLDWYRIQGTSIANGPKVLD
jgi:UDP-glucose 4-epimerase